MITQRYAGLEIGVASAEAFTCYLRDGGVRLRFLGGGRKTAPILFDFA